MLNFFTKYQARYAKKVMLIKKHVGSLLLKTSLANQPTCHLELIDKLPIRAGAIAE